MYVIEIGVMRHLFQVFSDDPKTLRGFILNLRSCLKIASENSRFLLNMQGF